MITLEKSNSIPSENTMTNYETFYKNVTIQKIKEILREKKIECEFTIHDSTILFKNVKEIKSTIWQAIIYEKYFLVLPERNDQENNMSISLGINYQDKNFFYPDLIQIASSHEDPVKFLIDHKSYWTFRAPEAIAILAQPENLEKPRVMAALEEAVTGTKVDFGACKEAIRGLGRALAIPTLKEKAKSLLLHVAVFDSYAYSSYFRLRELAWKELRPIIDEEEVRNVFQKIAQSDPRISLRFDALNYLDKIDSHKSRLKVEILTHIISNFNLNKLDNSQGTALDYVLWSNQPYSYQAIQALGEGNIVRTLLSQFLESGQVPAIHITGCRGLTPIGGLSAEISNSAHFYSILKFIGIHTNDKMAFISIVSALISVAKGKDLGVLEPLSEVLFHLSGNPLIHSIELKDEKIKSPPGKQKPDTSFGGMSREADWDAYKSKKIQALISVLESSSDAALKKVAIRSCAEYFFTEHDYGWTQKENLGFAKKLVPVLKKLIASEADGGEAAGEAEFFLSLYLSIYGTKSNSALAS